MKLIIAKSVLSVNFYKKKFKGYFVENNYYKKMNNVKINMTKCIKISL